MKTAAYCLSLSVAAAISVGAVPIPVPPPQDDPRAPTRAAAGAGDYDVVVEGCVQGTRLTRLRGLRSPTWEQLRVSEWMLTGSREIMQQVRARFDRHEVEVVGVITPPLTMDPRHTTLGSHLITGPPRRPTEQSFVPDDAAPLRLEVHGIRLLAERCG